MKKYINDFLLMLQFLTRIPLNISLQCEKENFRRGATFLPLVGFIIGGVQWLVYYTLSKVLPVNITALMVVLTGILLTGALHVDGLGDTCDGFFAFKGKDRIIEIMKDSRIGTYACIAIVMDLLLKFFIASYLIENSLSMFIIAAPVISRFSIVFISFVGKPAKPNGSGNLFIGNMKKTVVFLSALISLAVSSALVGIRAAGVLFLSAILISSLNTVYCSKKIGGLTGDLLGANNEIIEALAILIYICVVGIL